MRELAVAASGLATGAWVLSTEGLGAWSALAVAAWSALATLALLWPLRGLRPLLGLQACAAGAPVLLGSLLGIGRSDFYSAAGSGELIALGLTMLTAGVGLLSKKRNPLGSLMSGLAGWALLVGGLVELGLFSLKAGGPRSFGVGFGFGSVLAASALALGSALLYRIARGAGGMRSVLHHAAMLGLAAGLLQASADLLRLPGLAGSWATDLGHALAALGVSLLAAGLLLAAAGRQRYAAAVLLPLAGLILVASLHPLLPGTPTLAELPPLRIGTLLALGLGTLAALPLLQARPGGVGRALAWTAGFGLMLAAGLALLGYLLATGLPGLPGDLRKLSPMLALAVASTGLALVLLADRGQANPVRQALMWPASAGLLVAALGVSAWVALQPNETQRLQLAGANMADQFAERVTLRLGGLRQALASHPARSGADATSLLAADPALLAVRTAEAWVPRAGEASSGLVVELERLELEALPADDHRALQLGPAMAGQPGMQALLALQAERGSILAALDVTQLAAEALGARHPDYLIELRENDSLLFGEALETLPQAHQRKLDAFGRVWTLSLAPRPELSQLMVSRLPLALLVLALLLGISLASALRLAVLGRQRAHQAERVARGLEREIAAREATESALDRSLDELGLILSSISDGFAFVDRGLKISFANRQAGELLAGVHELPPGTPLSALWPALFEDSQGKTLQRAIEDAAPALVEVRSPHGRWLELRAFPHLTGMALLVRDISGARERAQALARNESALRTAQSLARVGSWRYDLVSGQWLWSDELFRMLGLMPDQLPPSRELLLQCVAGPDRAAMQLALDALLSEGRGFDLDHHLLRADGRLLRVRSLGQAEHGSEGGIDSISGTVQDISLQQRQAAELQSALARSERQATQLQSLNRAALLASRKLGDLDLVPTLLTEVREALQAGLALLLPVEPGAAPIPAADLARNGPDNWAWTNAPGANEALDDLRKLLGQGPQRLSTAELLAQVGYGSLSSHLVGLPLAGLLSAPLQDGSGQCIAHLLLSRPSGDGFGAEDEAVLGQFAQMMALSLDWAALIEALRNTRRSLQEQVENLSRSRALLAGAERVAGLGTWQVRFGADGASLEVSEQVARILGLEGAGADLESAKGRIHPEDRKRVREQYNILLERGHQIDIEYRVSRPDGVVRWVHTQAELSRDAQGLPLHLLGTLQDISRARAEQAVEHERAEILRGIATGRPLTETLLAIVASFERRQEDRLAVVFRTDDEGDVLEVVAPSLPPAFGDHLAALDRQRALGPSRQAARDRRQRVVQDVLADPLFSEVHELFRAAGIRAATATPVLAADDRVLGSFTVYHAQPHRPDAIELDAINAAVSLIAIAINSATAKRRIEEGRQRLRSLFALVPDAVFALDLEGRIEDCNAAAEAQTWRARASLTGQLVSAIVPAEETGLMQRQVELAARGGIHRFEHAALGPEGRRFRAVTTSLPIEVDGDAVGVFLIVSDVTEQRRAQAALQAAMADVQARNQELQDFAFIASHDLQEPLRKVQAFGDRLRLHLGAHLDAQGADYIQRMRGAASRMQTLINDLLAYSRVSRQAHRPRWVELSAVLDDVLSDLESRIEASGARVLADRLPGIEADPVQMHQLLQNLIGNAIKFAQPGRTPVVQVRARRLPAADGRAEQLELTVEDNGIGFDNRYLERIFAPFQRLHARQDYEGSGIGLAIVRKIVERHGGRLHADGRPGEGARFIVELPMARALLSLGPEVCEDSGR
ncbi:MAG: PAS domain S-box protein [Aquimonas sp.]|nr:PAS domain S-box protein [Aquimonas sp.]